MTLHGIQTEIRRLLERAGIPTAEREAAWFVEHVCGIDRAGALARSHDDVGESDVLTLRRLGERRALREPFQYIIGEADFFGRSFLVQPGVLIPRADTETLIQVAKDVLSGAEAPEILDLGCGSGCIGITMALEMAEASVAAADLSGSALTVTRQNAVRLNADLIVERHDMTDPDLSSALPGPWTAILSNPPYVPSLERNGLEPEVRDHEPAMALFPGADTLRFYRALARYGRQTLAKDGWLIVEVHCDYAAEVRQLMEQNGFRECLIYNDLASRPRVVSAKQP